MTDIMFTRTALTEAAEKAGVTTDQARTILEAAGVKVEPEKPALPTKPGSVIIATEVRGVTGKWVLVLDDIGEWYASPKIEGRRWHRPGHITAWIETVVLPVAAAPVTLTEDQVGELWGEESTPLGAWSALVSRNRERITATVNAALAQHAAPAEGEPIADAAKPIDPADVRVGDRVRLVLRNGEATFIVANAYNNSLHSTTNTYYERDITAAYLLHREEA